MSDPAHENTAIADLMDSLLCGEIAAAETYEQALDGLEDESVVAPLRLIQREHGAAIRYLYNRVAEHGGTPSTRSGVWGAFARGVEGAAVTLGESSALAVLREGERLGLSKYHSALAARPDLPEDCRTHIRQVRVPEQERHIDVLSRLLERVRPDREGVAKS